MGSFFDVYCIYILELKNDLSMYIIGIGLVRIPTLSKAPLDLFKVYSSVQNLGGFVNVSSCFLFEYVHNFCYWGKNEQVPPVILYMPPVYMLYTVPVRCKV